MTRTPPPLSGPRCLLRAWLLVILLFAVAAGLQRCHAAEGITSWYGEDHRGRLMANGRPFNPDAHTCASWFHPLGTRLRVAHGSRTVVVTVTDRGPARRLLRTRQLDLSRAAFAALAQPRVGLLPVTITPLEP